MLTISKMGNINKTVLTKLTPRVTTPKKVGQAIASDEAELKRRGYTLGSKLGEGSYAKVRWATCKKDGRKVALKIISPSKAPANFQEKFLPRELEVLKMLDHPNIVRLYEVFALHDKARLRSLYPLACAVIKFYL